MSSTEEVRDPGRLNNVPPPSTRAEIHQRGLGGDGQKRGRREEERRKEREAEERRREQEKVTRATKGGSREMKKGKS